MSLPRPNSESTVGEMSEQEIAFARAVTAWVPQLARTLKTGRLYDPSNPTAQKFREDLSTSLSALLETYGPMTLRFTANDVLFGETSLYPARSREDNLALPFYRDGIRSITFSPGIESREIATLLDLLLRVTARGSDDEDLVSLLWDAQLGHVDMKYVSTEADTDAGGGEEAPSESRPDAAPMAWPSAGQSSGSGDSAAPARAEDASAEAPEGSDVEIRSDDWMAGSPTGTVDTVLLELEAGRATEIERFLLQYRAEHEVSSVASTLALVRDCIDTSDEPGDFVDLANFLPRLLNESLTGGLWRDAHEAMSLLKRCPGSVWTPDQLLDDLAQPGSVVTGSVVAHLDHRGLEGLEEFLSFAADFGPAAVDWLVRILSESQQQRTRRRLVKAIAVLCRENPECLAPWISDERWYVVRNVASVLSLIGGNPVVGLLRAATRHSDLRVRIEVIGALAQADPEVSRPLLLEMLNDPETRIFCAALHQLAARRDRDVSRLLLGLLEAQEFERRPMEEQRAIYLALAGTSDDDALPRLEAELLKGGWLAHGADAHRQSLARCIARIGTPASRELLERAARSRNGAVRKICQDVMAGMAGRV